MIVVIAVDRCDRVAVTVETPRTSEIVEGDIDKVMSGSASSSVIVSIRATGIVAPLSLCTIVGTVTLLSGASVVLSTAVRITVSDAFAVCPAAMVIVESVPTV